jgi:hypothetical protein
MTTSIRSLGISFELEKYRSLRGDDDVRDMLVKTSVEIHQVRQTSVLSDRFRHIHASLENSGARLRHVPTPHLATSSTANPHSIR